MLLSIKESDYSLDCLVQCLLINSAVLPWLISLSDCSHTHFMLFPQSDRNLNLLTGIWEATDSDTGRTNLTRDLVGPPANVGVAPNIRPRLLHYTFLAVRYVPMIIPVDDLTSRRRNFLLNFSTLCI